MDQRLRIVERLCPDAPADKSAGVKSFAQITQGLKPYMDSRLALFGAALQNRGFVG